MPRGRDHTVDWFRPYEHTCSVSSAVRKVTVNLPAKLLERARATTGLGITETIVKGLEELERGKQRSALQQLRGRIRIELDLDETRK